MSRAAWPGKKQSIGSSPQQRGLLREGNMRGKCEEEKKVLRIDRLEESIPLDVFAGRGRINTILPEKFRAKSRKMVEGNILPRSGFRENLNTKTIKRREIIEKSPERGASTARQKGSKAVASANKPRNQPKNLKGRLWNLQQMDKGNLSLNLACGNSRKLPESPERKRRTRSVGATN